MARDRHRERALRRAILVLVLVLRRAILGQVGAPRQVISAHDHRLEISVAAQAIDPPALARRSIVPALATWATSLTCRNQAPERAALRLARAARRPAHVARPASFPVTVVHGLTRRSVARRLPSAAVPVREQLAVEQRSAERPAASRSKAPAATPRTEARQRLALPKVTRLPSQAARDLAFRILPALAPRVSRPTVARPMAPTRHFAPVAPRQRETPKGTPSPMCVAATPIPPATAKAVL